MKISLLTILITMLGIIIWAGGGDGTLVYAQEAPKNNIAFGGIRYDDGVLLSGGYGRKLGLGNLWSLSYANAGNYLDINTELAYFFQFEGFEGFHIGVLAGENADWVDTYNDNKPPITYIVSSAGVIGTYDFNDLGIWGYGKYKFTLTPNGNNYIDGYIFGGGLSYRF